MKPEKPAGIYSGVRKTVKPTYGYDHRSVFMLWTGAVQNRTPHGICNKCIEVRPLVLGMAYPSHFPYVC